MYERYLRHISAEEINSVGNSLTNNDGWGFEWFDYRSCNDSVNKLLSGPFRLLPSRVAITINRKFRRQIIKIAKYNLVYGEAMVKLYEKYKDSNETPKQPNPIVKYEPLQVWQYDPESKKDDYDYKEVVKEKKKPIEAASLFEEELDVKKSDKTDEAINGMPDANNDDEIDSEVKDVEEEVYEPLFAEDYIPTFDEILEKLQELIDS